jgi:hypothetical protein
MFFGLIWLKFMERISPPGVPLLADLRGGKDRPRRSGWANK